jgi:hypothetical protein
MRSLKQLQGQYARREASQRGFNSDRCETLGASGAETCRKQHPQGNALRAI